MPMTFRVLCPAKINPFLAVGPVDERGYHPLRSIFQAISLSDELVVRDCEPSEAGIFCDWEGLPQRNTVQKALDLAWEFVQLPPLRIELTKRIPSEAGLGGGSSDAAGLLRVLPRFSLGVLSPEIIRDIAQAVGADVPFFLTGGRARAEGYGERLTPLPDLVEREWYVVLKPEVGCATGEAYARLDANPYPWREFPEGDELYNDFERVMPCDSDDWQERLLTHGAKDVLLCGSGSSIFGRYVDEAAAERACERLRGEGAKHVWVCHSLTRLESLAIAPL